MLTRIAQCRLTWPLAGLALILLFNAVFVPSFYSLEVRDGRLYGSLVDVLNRGSIGAIVALGMTLVVATGGVDLSVGSIMAISGAVAALALTESEAGLMVALALALGSGVLAGVANGALVSLLRIQPIIATLILMVCGRGIARYITGEKVISLADQGAGAWFDYLANGHFLGLPTPITITLSLFVVTAVATRRTVLGLLVESVGANELASRCAGVNTTVIRVAVYAFSGFCAAVAGLIDTSNIKAADTVNAGLYTELDAIFAVVVGGTALTGGRFSLAGSVLGALLLQTLLTTMYTFGVAPDTAPVPKSLVILGVCLLQSDAFRKRFRGGVE
ncbi:Inner membrane ABC transporter permease protein YtfT [Planctomycetes bacterium MalM25]|nr:Inner membrane ABC transporter permease protein YtfT [Planctomycetes bacterium MalM25]